MTRRYVVLTEGREDIRGIIVVPGAVRPKYDASGYIPVTLGYNSETLIGRARDFRRAGVVEGECKITFEVEFFPGRGYSEEFVEGLTPGVFISNIYTYQPDPSNPLKHLTDGDIREISFYDNRPPASIRLEN